MSDLMKESNHYTTGEVAKLCGVSVRTVQYYDSRGILTPSDLSEGGRRLYCEEALRRMKVICFLRELGLSINSIGRLLSEEHPNNIIELLLDGQEDALREELNERQEKLARLEELRREMKLVERLSVESFGDIAYRMEHKKKLKRLRAVMLAVGIPLDLIQLGTLLIGILKGIWWPFAVGMCFVLVMAAWVSWYYYKHVAYICPQCHEVFKPSFKAAFFSAHTPNTRKLTCPGCGHKGYCVETIDEKA